MSEKLYGHFDSSEYEPHYCKHVMAMTAEELHSKADIASELAYRDQEIERLRAENEGLKEKIKEFEILVEDLQYGVDS